MSLLSLSFHRSTASPIDLDQVRAGAEVNHVSIVQEATRWEVHIGTTRPVSFVARSIPEGNRFYVDFPDCRLALGSPTFTLIKGSVTVRAAQFSIDPAIVRVVVQSTDRSLLALETPAPSSEAVVWGRLPAPAERTRIEITRWTTPRSLPRPFPRGMRGSRGMLASRGGVPRRLDPDALVVHPDSLEAFDEPPVPSDGGSLDAVDAADLSRPIRSGVRAALAGNHRYVWGGETPEGFDCSGMTQFIYRAAGVRIPRTAAEQFRTGRPVDSGDLQPGDLVFFSNGTRIFHVAIYIGHGRIFHAANPRRGLTTDLLTKSFYADHYAGARRYGPG